MKGHAKFVALCLGVLAFFASVLAAQPMDPTGTWKLNLAKSKFSTPPPKSMTVTFKDGAKGYDVSVDAVGPDGQPQKWGFTSTFDGSERPVLGNPGIDTVIARTTENGSTVEYRKAGKVVTTTSSVMSEDGKTLTVTVKVVAAQGKEVTNISVYDKQ